MLVVLMVVVLLTSLATLNLSSGASERRLEETLDRLRGTAGYALDEAQFSGSDFGLLFSEQLDDRGQAVLLAQWRQRQPGGWGEPLRSSELFADLLFPPEVDVFLQLDATPVIPARAEAANPQSGVAPQWWFVASGETQPGELLLRDADSGDVLWRLSWDALGRFERFRGSSVDAQGDYASGF
jgi:hypothetical protein